MEHLWLRGGVFPDWIADDVATLRACERYSCRPSELDGEDWHMITRHAEIKAAEARYLEMDARSRGRR